MHLWVQPVRVPLTTLKKLDRFVSIQICSYLFDLVLSLSRHRNMYYANIHTFTADYHGPFQWDPLAKLTIYAELYLKRVTKLETFF